MVVVEEVCGVYVEMCVFCVVVVECVVVVGCYIVVDFVCYI